MKTINKTLRQALLAALACPAAHAMAITDSDAHCKFEPLSRGELKVHILDLGTLYVPRDARVGTSIGTPNARHYTRDENELYLSCTTNGERINFEYKATRGVHSHLHAVDGRFAASPILRTNIPGIGAIIEKLSPFSGRPGHFIPEGSLAMVPFTSYIELANLSPVALVTFNHEVTLIKTGELQPGEHDLDGVLVTGHLGWGGFGKVQEYIIKAKIIQSHCEIGTDAVEVSLGEWNINDFTHVGYKTEPIPFQIRLDTCKFDSRPDPANETLATIELRGVEGSRPIGPAGEHVFSLTTESQASGIGIQMLHNGQPMPLNQELDLQYVTADEITLGFEARYFQTEPKRDVQPGSANGALNFVIRYR
ncbi:TPA: type 1 fimbrial protein [Pseudomonas putida]|nr:type 1 fimbrial protein [Pseudomonas putida]